VICYVGEIEQREANMARHTGTNATTPYHIFKDEVAKAAGLSVDRLHVGRLLAAYDMGEPVWMVADEMRVRDEAAMPPVKPYALPRLDRVCIRRVRV
jgi:hypothetical protein